jgi:hypothetical protein
MVISFSLTVGVLLWQRRTENPPPRSAQPAAALPRIAAAVEAPTPPAAAVGDSEPPPARHGDAIPTQDMAEQDSSNLVPMEITLRYLTGKEKWEARLKNSSEESMTVGIRILSAGSRSESAIQHTFAAYELLRLGFKDDLVLQTGDQITLQSAPYRDLVKVVGFE